MATLAVQEAMGMKVDREAVATLVLPQLWAMSMGPRECPRRRINRISPLTDLAARSFDCITVQAIHGGHSQTGR